MANALLCTFPHLHLSFAPAPVPCLSSCPPLLSAASPARASFLFPSALSSSFANRVASARAFGDGVEVTTTTTELEGEILSGEWPENFSMLNYEDLSAHYEAILFKDEAQPDTILADVMSTTIYTATVDQLLEEVDHFFLSISGLPVINENLRCVGVLSKKDRSKALQGVKSVVGDVMSSPAITLSADKTVKDAAVLMLKKKIHRIPVVNESEQVVGIVTRTDIFTALEGGR